MNSKEYIESGVLELYVSGLLSIEEMRDVEAKACQYAEIKTELEALQNTLEAFARKHAMMPPAELKQRIMKAIKSESERDEEHVSREVKVRAISSSRNSASRYLAAASIALLIAVGAIAFYFSSQYQKTKDQMAQLQSEFQNQQASFQKQLSDLQLTAGESSNKLQLLTDTSTVWVAMKGTPKHTGNMVLIYWNKRTQEVYLEVASLPEPPPNSQYQLWFIDPKKGPVSAGVFDVKPGEIMKMSPASAAAAFAVTLEPRGGSAAPTLSNMYVIGNVNS